ncbi:MAG: beta-L-arabinofuranosidase domain-containing protein [Verrucomicrobiia bacterium]
MKNIGKKGVQKHVRELLFAAGLRLIACLFCFGLMHHPAMAGHDTSNRVPLQSQPYMSLPPGSVKATGWLKHQLELQRDGLTGDAETLYADIGQSDWISGKQQGGEYAWERGPYYAKGLISLAYVLDDAGLKAKARKWIDQIIVSQRPDGDFGPKKRNWWANMIVLHYMRDYYETTHDARALAFLDKYFRFQLKTLPGHPLCKDSKWAQARGGDNLEIVIWLYNLRGGDELLKLASLLVEQTGQWEQYYADGTGINAYPEHIVNVMQGLKTPPLMYLLSHKQSHRDGYWNATKADGWLMKQYGRVDYMFNGTEGLTDRSSTEGTELCAIVERILSCTVAIGILGDAYIGDQLETVAYNALPAALSPDIKGLRYYSLQNQPKCTDEDLGFKQNGTGKSSICPSPHSGFGCCRSNFHFGWPKFVQNMWMATEDHGLALITYGPNSVTAKVGTKGSRVSIRQDTGYPFHTVSTLTVITDKKVAFPLKVRIPGWCLAPNIHVNGKKLENVTPGKFFEIARTWENGDVVKLDFPMTPRVSRWINNSVAISRGPLVCSLHIEEEPWKSTKDFNDNTYHTYEIRPASAWNYALLLKNTDMPEIETSVSDTIPLQPFKTSDAPVRLKLKAVRTSKDGWGTYRKDFPGRATEPPVSPVEAPGTTESITLVPYGSTGIRVTLFPWAKN